MTISGDIGCYTNYIADIKKITAQDIQNAANKYLLDSRMAISALMPENSNTSSSTKPSELNNNIKNPVLNDGMTLS